jgi:hypothetical protein
MTRVRLAKQAKKSPQKENTITNKKIVDSGFMNNL